MRLHKFMSGALFVALTVSLSGCGDKQNTKLATQDDSSRTYSNPKADLFFNTIGSPLLNNADTFVQDIQAPPKNFNPDLSNPKFLAIKDDVENFVLKQADNYVPKKIISIEPLGAKLLGADNTTISTVQSFVSVPYLERGETNNNNVHDLSAIKSASGLSDDGAFAVYNTINGKINKDKPAMGHAYLLTYQVGNENHLAIITIPDAVKTSGKPVPLMMFAHGGDSGLSFREMAILLQGNLNNFIVAAPVYPGEPVCAVQSTRGTASNAFHRDCLNHVSSIVPPAVASSVLQKSPMKDDVASFLALFNGIRMLGDDTPAINIDSGVNIFKFENSKNSLVIPSQSVAVADSRGGATLMASLGRLAIIKSIVGIILNPNIPDEDQSKKDANDKIKNLDLGSLLETSSGFFGAAAFYFSPSSFLVGEFRLLSQFMLSGNVPGGFNKLPMVPEMKNYFNSYLNAKVGTPEEQVELHKLIGFIGSSDITYLAPFISLSVNNGVDTAMPGSILFMHGTQDGVVPFTESIIAKHALDLVFNSIYSQNASSNPLIAGQIVPVGSQFYAFQPDNHFYNIPSGRQECSALKDSNGNYLGNYNPLVNKCFGDLISDDQEQKFVDHGMDASFLTSHVMNAPLLNASESDLRNMLLFGFNSLSYDKLTSSNCDLSNLNSTCTLQDQITVINSMNPAKPLYSTELPDCSTPNLTNGLCYNRGSKVSDSFKVFPQYYRSLEQDGFNSELEQNLNISKNYSNAVNGIWNNAAQSSALTPTDLLSSWANNVVLDPNYGVFVTYH